MSGVDDLLDSNSAVYRTLLESTLAIPWKIDWATMKFAYIGPQIEPLLGWERDSWISADDWATRIHADDREHVVNFCISQSKAGVDHEADYRALTRDNGYVWIRDVVHVVRDDKGEVEALVGFMFDISERKKTEARLLSLQKELEALSFKDGLTGAANRRMFDARLDQEWKNAARSGQPLSVILLDIDYFKQYNDFYGQLRRRAPDAGGPDADARHWAPRRPGGALRWRGVRAAAARNRCRHRARSPSVASE